MSLVPSARLIGAAAALLLFGTVAAQASEATLVADRAGFLLGHAHRCGVPEKSLQRSRQLVGEVIATFAVDDDDRQDAEAGFALRVLASTLARHLGDPLPSCAAIRSQLARLGQHGRPALARSGNEGEGRMARNDRSTAEPAPPDVAAETGRAKARKSATTRREELTPERRAELELKRAARQMRGRPPSI